MLVDCCAKDYLQHNHNRSTRLHPPNTSTMESEKDAQSNWLPYDMGQYKLLLWLRKVSGKHTEELQIESKQL